MEVGECRSDLEDSPPKSTDFSVGLITRGQSLAAGYPLGCDLGGFTTENGGKSAKIAQVGGRKRTLARVNGQILFEVCVMAFNMR
ncbi:hypothetical protein [Actinoplanes sp. G11-F43]|uniref:hypothetical protein n=1 Tax=Actinoplanes sp. G11-F43 TaxID=3424130 RepID=UPI003D344C32